MTPRRRRDPSPLSLRVGAATRRPRRAAIRPPTQVEQLDTPGSIAHKLREWFVNGTVVVEGVGRVKPHIPDETFFPSVLMTSPFRETGVPRPVEVVRDVTGPDPTAEKAFRASFYVRMDEHYPWSNATQRYTSGLDKRERPWGPYYVGTYDLGAIRESRALFVRKTSRSVDPNIFKLLPVDDYAQIPDIRWPDGPLTVSDPKPRVATVKRGDEDGCVRVAESVHCPPRHMLGADVHEGRRVVEKMRGGGEEL